MSFVVDKQTLDDLNIFSKRGRKSIFTLFNRTHTRGGAQVLEQMFRYPLTDARQINDRTAIIQYFQQQRQPFPFPSGWFDTVEQYLVQNDERSRLHADDHTVARQLQGLLGADTAFKTTKQAVITIRQLLGAYRDFLRQLPEGPGKENFLHTQAGVADLLDEPVFSVLADQFSPGKLTFEQVAAYDQQLRFRDRDRVRMLLQQVYHLDVYVAVAMVASELGFRFASAMADGGHRVMLKGVYHPQVAHAVGNDLTIDVGSNIVFLTGANMAGKSTLMKSLGIAVYLAHIGFPVAAQEMEFTVRDGLFTTINLADNLNQGYSHFYAEVHRVKQVSEALATGKNLFVIFDELFRGTNVKDAYEATVAITKAYARHSNCMFVVSTHIIEAGDELRMSCPNINFTYLPTRMEGDMPVYTYQLASGITADRHGMVIIQQEQVLDLLEQGLVKPSDRPSQTRFLADKQTLEDLQLLGKFKSRSIFSLFNQTRTDRGERLLEQLFREPLTDIDAIAERQQMVSAYQQLNSEFPVSGAVYAGAERYLRKGSHSGPLAVVYQSVRRSLLSAMGLHEAYNHALEGLNQALQALLAIADFIDKQTGQLQLPALVDRFKTQQQFINRHLAILRQPKSTKLTWWQALRCEVLLRGKASSGINALLDFMEEVDAYQSIASVSRNHGLQLPLLRPATENILHIEQGYHLAIPGAVANTISLTKQENFMFLTGANMAGKSTIMKTIGICTYLAHLGMPVPAKGMAFSPKQGMFTSINVPDNLDMGYSHFYAEVLRVKHVAQAVASGQNLVIIFDELFKGTNVKDAFDATLAVSKAFAAYRNCQFIISTHIVEVGHELASGDAKVQFRYMPTVMDGTRATYPYTIAGGISDDRHGMMIIKNEKILDILGTSSHSL